MYKSLKYGLVALALLSSSLVGCKDKEEVIPASEHLRVYHQRYDQYLGEHNSSLESARRKISDACLDGIIKVDEQKAILDDFNSASLAREKFRKNLELAPERASLYLGWPERDEQPFVLLNQNINGFDGSRPALEGYFKEKGKEVRVEEYESSAEVSVEVAAEVVVSIIEALASD